MKSICGQKQRDPSTLSFNLCNLETPFFVATLFFVVTHQDFIDYNFNFYNSWTFLLLRIPFFIVTYQNLIDYNFNLYNSWTPYDVADTQSVAIDSKQ